MLESGAVRAKNSSNIMLKNMMDAAVSAITFYLIGFGFANELDGGLMGNDHFLGMNYDSKIYLKWIYQYAYCSTSATIVSGSLAERTFIDTYLIFSFLMGGMIYPIVSGWAWGGGWL